MRNVRTIFKDFRAEIKTMQANPTAKKPTYSVGNFSAKSIAHRKAKRNAKFARTASVNVEPFMEHMNRIATESKDFPDMAKNLIDRAHSTPTSAKLCMEALKRSETNKASGIDSMNIELKNRNFGDLPTKAELKKLDAKSSLDRMKDSEQQIKSAKANFEFDTLETINQKFDSDLVRYANEFIEGEQDANIKADQAIQRNEQKSLESVLNGKSDSQVLQAIAQKVGLTAKDF